MKQYPCHCGQPHQYADEKIEKRVEDLISQLGEMIDVQVGMKKYRVQRRYIAFHGIKGVVNYKT